MKYPLTLFLLLLSIWQLQAQLQDWESYIRPDRAGEVLENETTIWIPTTAGLLEYNKQDNSHQLWNKVQGGLVSNSIEDVAVHPFTNAIYIGTYDLALMVREAGTETWQHLPYPAGLLEDFGGMIRIYCLEFDEEGILWVGTDRGLLRYDGEEWSIIDSFSNSFLGAVWDLDFSANGKLYISSHGLFTLENNELMMISPEDAVDGHFIFGYGYSTLQLLPNGHLWFITDTGMVGYYDGTAWSDVSFVPEMNFSGSAYSVWADTDGHINVVIPERSWFEHTNEGWQEKAGWTSMKDLLRIAPLQSGQQLSITDKQLQLEDGTGIHYTSYDFKDVLFGFEHDAAGSLWVIDSNGRILQLDSGEEIIAEGENAPVFGFNDYTFSNQGILWCIAGKSVHQLINGVWKKFDASNSVLPDSYGYRIIVPGAGETLWLSVYGQGLYFYNGNQWQEASNPAFLTNYIIDIQPVETGVWVAMLDEQNEALLAFWDGTTFETVDDGVAGFQNVYLSDLAYRDGRLWALGYSSLQYLEEGNWTEYTLPFTPGENNFFRKVQPYENRLLIHTPQDIWLQEGGEWLSWNAANSPIDNERISEVSIDKNNGLWILHGNNTIVERLELEVLNSHTKQPLPAHKTLRVMGNPVTGSELTLLSEDPLESTKIIGAIYDAAGKVYPLTITAATGRQIKLNIGSLPAGWYTGRLRINEEQYIVPFIKQ
jgi:ligand-binding sensor domain-containing protein